ncbi:MAG TPA: peptidoglycan DD-metalloendopeptidase family protein, partial [Prolixibacteraceae bacterium]|nr:peptidoglycan DD-metalloendopeptidase family protein [Prolixibacteraceae bacterium]
MPRYNILLLLFVLLGQPVAAQLKYYATPVRIPVSFSGNFGELRPDHFHMGLDFRTERRTGLPIHASAEGYVARVVVSPTGYGRALYVNHPNQTTTVYGHLLQFRSDIEAWVKE